jgi:hypothetical protein
MKNIKCENCRVFNLVNDVTEPWECGECGTLNYPKCGQQPRRPKTKRQRKKVAKGMFYHCNGAMLWKHHAYQWDRGSSSIMLCYDENGNELYFDNWKDAKKYIRTMKPVKNNLPF